MVWSVDTLNLTKDIAVSRRVRQESRKQMRDDTRNALEKAQAELAQAGTERAEQARTDLMQRQADLKEINTLVQAILEKAEAVLAQAGMERAEQAKADLMQRQADLKEMNTLVQAILEKAEAELAQAGTERAEQAKANLIQRQADLKEINAQVQAILEKAKAELAQAGTERAEQARTDFEQRHAVTQNRIAAIGEMLGKCRTERENASLAWQKLADMMFTKDERPSTKTTVSPPEEKPTSGAGLKSTILDKTQLPDAVFNYLTTHPAGIRMTELEKEFDVPRIHMAQIIKNLLDNNKVEKREKLYFANQTM